MNVVKDMLASKKFIAVLVTIAVWVGGRFGFEVDELTLTPVFAALAAYILGQGIADHGKEAAKITAAAAAAEKREGS
jgi:hypothetical protein